ncbi:hypothetical protein LINPERHAP1_LOCUS14413 [Linum perenne]
MENSGVGDDDDDREVLVWDCGSPLYDSYEIASVGHLIERHTMSLPSSPSLISRWINSPPGAASVVGVSNRRTLVSSKSGISGYCKDGVVKQSASRQPPTAAYHHHSSLSISRHLTQPPTPAASHPPPTRPSPNPVSYLADAATSAAATTDDLIYSHDNHEKRSIVLRSYPAPPLVRAPQLPSAAPGQSSLTAPVCFHRPPLQANRQESQVQVQVQRRGARWEMQRQGVGGRCSGEGEGGVDRRWSVERCRRWFVQRNEEEDKGGWVGWFGWDGWSVRVGWVSG